METEFVIWEGRGGVRGGGYGGAGYTGGARCVCAEVAPFRRIRINTDSSQNTEVVVLSRISEMSRSKEKDGGVVAFRDAIKKAETVG